MFNVAENFHRSPYEELQSVNADGFIVGLRMSQRHNPIVQRDYEMGRMMLIEGIKHENNPEYLQEKAG